MERHKKNWSIVWTEDEYTITFADTYDPIVLKPPILIGQTQDQPEECCNFYIGESEDSLTLLNYTRNTNLGANSFPDLELKIRNLRKTKDDYYQIVDIWDPTLSSLYSASGGTVANETDGSNPGIYVLALGTTTASNSFVEWELNAPEPGDFLLCYNYGVDTNKGRIEHYINNVLVSTLETRFSSTRNYFQSYISFTLASAGLFKLKLKASETKHESSNTYKVSIHQQDVVLYRKPV